MLGPMPRKLRIQYAGAIYHVMNRGDRREAIFADEHDRRNRNGRPLAPAAVGERSDLFYLTLRNAFANRCAREAARGGLRSRPLARP